MPDKSKEKDNLCTACQDCCSHHKNTPRSVAWGVFYTFFIVFMHWVCYNI